MLSVRTEKILKLVVEDYIHGAVPVPSQKIVDDYSLGVSPATIRNEMALLEREGYLVRPYSSAGSVPTDKGYRFYVESLTIVTLPEDEQRLISHLFHQVEREFVEALHLAADLMSQTAQNVAVVTVPRPVGCHFKHVELVSVQDYMILLILVLSGANVRQKLISFEQNLTQDELAVIANKLNSRYSGLNSAHVAAKNEGLSPVEQGVTDCVMKIMEGEDQLEFDEPYLHGMQYMLGQPEFAQNKRMLGLMELVERRQLLQSIVPQDMRKRGVQVIIGKENKVEVIHDYSVIISHYGLPGEAVGTIGVLGPTRMAYGRTIATVAYLSSMLSEVVAELYKRQNRVKKAR